MARRNIPQVVQGQLCQPPRASKPLYAASGLVLATIVVAGTLVYELRYPNKRSEQPARKPSYAGTGA